MYFELTKYQRKALNIWKDKIFFKYEKYGIFRYTFTDLADIVEISVYSELADEYIDLTNVTEENDKGGKRPNNKGERPKSN